MAAAEPRIHLVDGVNGVFTTEVALPVATPTIGPTAYCDDFGFIAVAYNFDSNTQRIIISDNNLVATGDSM